MNCFYGMVERRKAFSLISSRDHCQRSSPSRISDTPRAGFEPADVLSQYLKQFSSYKKHCWGWIHTLCPTWILRGLRWKVWKVSVFGVILVCIRPGFGEILRISPYSVRMWTIITPKTDTICAVISASRARKDFCNYVNKQYVHKYTKP